MSRTLLLAVRLFSGFLLTAMYAAAQQDQKPVILGESVLCPNSGSVLHTQKIYDSYQWFERDFFSNKKVAIPGADSSEITVNDSDVLKYISVEVTLNGRKAISDETLVDGKVFVLPSVRSGGDFKNGPGFFGLIQGDTGVFTLLQPYNTNITWYRNGQAIDGATSNKLFVTEEGSYNVQGAPDECPNYIQNVGVDLIVKVRTKTLSNPVVTGDSLLCPGSGGTLTVQTGYNSYQWYKRWIGLNKRHPVKGATSNSIDVNAAKDPGAYFSCDVTFNGDTLTSNEVLVDSYVFLLPSVISDGDFINGPGYFILKKGDTGTFTITQPYDTNIKWYRNEKRIAGEDSTTLLVTKGGSYFVQGAPAVCPDFVQNPGLTLEVKQVSDTAAQSSTSLSVQKNSNEIELFPNPAKNVVMLNTTALLDKKVTVTIVDMNGKTRLTKQYSSAPAYIQINIASLASGNYFARIASDETFTAIKFVVNK